MRNSGYFIFNRFSPLDWFVKLLFEIRQIILYKKVEGLQWRTGVALHDRAFHAQAVVKVDEEERRIYIYVSGQQKRDYFAIIRKTIRDINASFEKLKTTELVPLPDHPGITVEYEELTGHEKMGSTEITIGKIGKRYPVAQLLDGIEKPEERKGHGYYQDSGKPYPPTPPPNEPENKFWKNVIYVAAIMTILAAKTTIINSIL